MINVGALNHPFHPHGNHTTQIAQDGRLLLARRRRATEHFGETIGSGQTRGLPAPLGRRRTTGTRSPTRSRCAQPNYRNLTFKDGNTWYSGSPYLGYKGTLPTGTTSQNVCGEWYFPWHSHALNEFTNFDEGFGGMAHAAAGRPARRLLRARRRRPTIVGGALKSGTRRRRSAVDDAHVLPGEPEDHDPADGDHRRRRRRSRSPRRPASRPPARTTSASTTRSCRSPAARARPPGRSRAASSAPRRRRHASRRDGHGARDRLVRRLQRACRPARTNLKVTLQGQELRAAPPARPARRSPTNLPQQTVKICNWTIAGAAGCATATSAGWVTLPAPPAQPQSVGSTRRQLDVDAARPGQRLHRHRRRTAGQVRVLVHTQRWTAPAPAPFSTWGNLMKIVYDAP